MKDLNDKLMEEVSGGTEETSDEELTLEELMKIRQRNQGGPPSLNAPNAPQYPHNHDPNPQQQ